MGVEEEEEELPEKRTRVTFQFDDTGIAHSNSSDLEGAIQSDSPKVPLQASTASSTAKRTLTDEEIEADFETIAPQLMAMSSDSVDQDSISDILPLAIQAAQEPSSDED
jgi:hypothetical protein